MAMLVVWGRRNSSNVIPVMWTVAELGIEHVRKDVGGSFGGLDSPDYLAMNPTGRIPTIEDDDFVLWESNAIVRYLCRRYGAGSLAPEDVREQALAEQWMEWHKTTFYPPLMDLFWALVRTEPALRDERRIGDLSRIVGRILGVLDARLASAAHVAGERLSMADIPLGAAIYRYLHLDIERPDLPGVERWYRGLSERPAFREHVMIPFGAKPAEWYLLEQAGGGK